MQMRRKVWKKTAVLLAAFVLGSTGISSCKMGTAKLVFFSELGGEEVFRINDRVCSLAEAKVFLTNYQNIYGNFYNVNLWEHDFGENSLEQYVKDLTISQLAQIISMDFLAEQQEISLTEEELKQVKKAAKAYYASLSKAELKYMGISEESMIELYRQYGLANKLYAHLTLGINDEVSDDEARVMEAMQIFVTGKEDAKAISKGLKEGTDFLTLANTYDESGNTEFTFGRGELPLEVEEIAFSLNAGEVSKVIETPEGYYFIKCINNYNRELTDANKQIILEKRRKEAFEDVYEAYIATIPSEFNEELWNSIEVEINEEIQTKSFFEVYEEYCN